MPNTFEVLFENIDFYQLTNTIVLLLLLLLYIKDGVIESEATNSLVFLNPLRLLKLNLLGTRSQTTMILKDCRYFSEQIAAKMDLKDNFSLRCACRMTIGFYESVQCCLEAPHVCAKGRMEKCATFWQLKTFSEHCSIISLNYQITSMKTSAKRAHLNRSQAHLAINIVGYASSSPQSKPHSIQEMEDDWNLEEEDCAFAYLKMAKE